MRPKPDIPPIDPAAEPPITLSRAIALPELARDGVPPSLATVYRWSTRGCRGHVLPTVQVGGSRCTSRAAVGRWLAALSGTKVTSAPAPADAISIDSELAAAGF